MGDKSFEIKKIILGFVLTSIVGTFLAFISQYIHDQYTYERNLLQSEKQQAQKHFEELSSLMDKRVYLTRKIYWVYDDALDVEIEQKRWDNYEKFLYEWNGQFNKNLALTERYFGEPKRAEFMDIHNFFRDIGINLQKVKNSQGKDTLSLQKAFMALEHVNPKIYFFDIELLNQIKDERIGVFLEKSNTRKILDWIKNSPDTSEKGN